VAKSGESPLISPQPRVGVERGKFNYQENRKSWPGGKKNVKKKNRRDDNAMFTRPTASPRLSGKTRDDKKGKSAEIGHLNRRTVLRKTP